jgi:hypothetical protein
VRDRIFLDGFSRGTYEVHTMAAMIHKVRLIQAGNEEQIIFAFDLDADRLSERPGSSSSAGAIPISQYCLLQNMKPRRTLNGTIHFDSHARYDTDPAHYRHENYFQPQQVPSYREIG